MLIEPFILIGACRAWWKKMSGIEAIGLFAKCIFSFLLILISDDYLFCFAIAQIAASCTVCFFWIALFFRTVIVCKEGSGKRSGFESFGDLVPCFYSIDYALTGSAVMFFLQSIIKFALSEGEKLVIMALKMNAKTLGIYSLISNLGSLIARYLFAQIEKTAHAEFSKLDIERNKSVIAAMLANLLKLVGFCAALCIAFAPNYSFIALDALYGAKWSSTEAPQSLALYCWYLLLLGLNGLTEAFVQSETPSTAYHAFLVAVTVLYWICVAYFMQMGVAGLILANCVNMIVRIAYNCAYIRLHNISLAQIFSVIRSWQLFVSLLISYFVTLQSNQFFVDRCGGHKFICYGMHCLTAVACLCFIGAVLWRYERKFLNDVRRLFNGSKML